MPFPNGRRKHEVHGFSRRLEGASLQSGPFSCFRRPFEPWMSKAIQKPELRMEGHVPRGTRMARNAAAPAKTTTNSPRRNESNS